MPGWIRPCSPAATAACVVLRFRVNAGRTLEIEVNVLQDDFAAASDVVDRFTSTAGVS